MLVFGRNVAREMLISGEKVTRAYLSDKFHDNEIYNLIKANKIKFKVVSNKFLDEKSKGLHQGIILEIDDVKTYTLDILKEDTNRYKNVIMLDHIEDPHNFGAIVRTAEALGVYAIIIPMDRSTSVNSTVVKTSCGAINNIKIIKVSNLTSTITNLKKQGYWIVGTDMQGEEYTKIDYKMNVCLVIGNEGKGMSKIVRDNCDYIASIAMIGKINSLNASVSCGIVLSEIKRQQGFDNSEI